MSQNYYVHKNSYIQDLQADRGIRCHCEQLPDGCCQYEEYEVCWDETMPAAVIPADCDYTDHTVSNEWY